MPAIIDIFVTCDGLQTLIDKYAEMPAEVTARIGSAMTKSLSVLREVAAEQKAPVAYGNLKNNIAIEPIVITEELVRGVVGAHRPPDIRFYPGFVETGTAPHSSGKLPPLDRLALWAVRADSPITWIKKSAVGKRGARATKDINMHGVYGLALHIRKHGMKANPFMHDTVAQEQATIDNFFRDELAGLGK